ncbi:MAG: outer membrane beta-barrel protein [Woeseiaceae bacterium]
MRHLSRSVLLLTFCATASLAADPGTERASISLGAFITDRDTIGRVDSETLGLGTVIDAEEDLGLDSSDTVARLDAYYKFNPRHRIDFSIFDLSRDATATIDKVIQFRDEIFDIDSTISTDLDLNIYKLAYTYSFLVRDEGYLGFTAGLFVLSSDISLRESNTGQFEVEDLTAPLPVIGLRGDYQFTPRLKLRSSGELFAIEFDDVDGTLFDFYVGLDYHFHDNFAVGLGYNNVSLDVDADGSDLKGSLDWTYDGALLNVQYSFGSIE